MTQGGKRPGAGRKPAPEGTKKLQYATKLEPAIVEYLREQDNAAKTIETAIERTKDFREWRKEYQA